MISIYDDYPQFVKVEDIYVADGKIVFEVKLHETIAYCTHFHAHQVKKNVIFPDSQHIHFSLDILIIQSNMWLY